MALAAGSRLGPYEILALLGTGGMGEVYRARDVKLNRDVAIKVLPDDWPRDPERLGRFEREAQVLAALNHPHIAHLHGYDDSTGQPALIMELVEGPTLADRLTAGPLPPAEALAIAAQLADALDAAHEQGIVHRDLKPANIKVRNDGTVKVLDFGLAKALGTDRPDQSIGSMRTAHTQAGLIVGTPAYMSPEQATGKPVDRRTDIWAFGCVLFEMLSGRPAFGGESVTEIIVSVMTKEPDWAALAAPTPAAVIELLRRCLEKDPRRRLRDIGDARLWLATSASAGANAASATARGWSAVAMVATAAVVGAALAAGSTIFWTRRPPANRQDVIRFQITPPLDAPFTGSPRGINIGVADDGSAIVYQAKYRDTFRLMLRRMSDVTAQPVPGTEGGLNPFFSPDGSRVGFVQNGQIRTVALDSGSVTTVCDAAGLSVFATWADDGTILFNRDSAAIFRVPASGGQPVQLFRAADGYLLGLGVEVLPGGDVLFLQRRAQSTAGRMSFVLRKGATTPQPVGEVPVGKYVSSGHLVYLQGANAALMAVPFDLRRAEVTGKPVEIQTGVSSNVVIARNGTVVFEPDHTASPGKLVWVERDGRIAGTITTDLERPRHPRISPDGQRLALTVGGLNFGETWVYNLTGASAPVKATYTRSNDMPLWRPDGRSLVVAVRHRNSLASAAADGSSVDMEQLLASEFAPVPQSWSADGESLLYEETHPGTGSDLLVYSARSRASRAWLQTPFNEGEASFSPDGHWVAYVSNQTGRDEVWVRPFTGNGSPLRLSSDGGHEPRWSRDGKTLFYQSGPKMIAADVALGPESRIVSSRVLFEGGFFPFDRGVGRTYDVAPDGRFVMMQYQIPPATLTVATHLTEQLKPVR